jgi:hypothetical protein
VQAWKSRIPRPLYGTEDPMAALDAAAKVDLLRQVDAYARSRDPRVSQVIVNLAATFETILVARHRRHAGRRRAPAGAPQRQRDRRAGRAPRAGQRRRRRPFRLRELLEAMSGAAWPTRPCGRRW